MALVPRTRTSVWIAESLLPHFRYALVRNGRFRQGHDRWASAEQNVIGRTPLHSLVILRHLAELLIARVEQVLQRLLLQLNEVLFQGCAERSGRGVIVMMRAA